MTPGWHHLLSCASTNDEALALGRAGAADGTVVLADTQTRGRGRQGRVWYSPPGESLYLSAILRPALRPEQAPLLTLCAGLALEQVLGPALGAPGSAAPGSAAPTIDERRSASLRAIELKWPNDVLVSVPGAPRRKLAGVLTELCCARGEIDFVVVGIGINLHGRRFPDELADRATSLAACRAAVGLPADPAVLDREALARRVVDALQRECWRYEAEGAAQLVRRFTERAAFLRRREEIQVHDGLALLRGRALGLSEDGALLMEDPSGAVRRVLGGEITLSG